MWVDGLNANPVFEREEFALRANARLTVGRS